LHLETKQQILTFLVNFWTKTLFTRKTNFVLLPSAISSREITEPWRKIKIRIFCEKMCCINGCMVIYNLVPDQLHGLGNKGPLKVLNDTKLILADHGNCLDTFRISLESFRSFRGPLLHKPVTDQELFFPVSYSKPALVISLEP
jgi:hypothetical protein